MRKLKLVADIWALTVYQVVCSYIAVCIVYSWCKYNFTWSDFCFCPKSYSGVCKCMRWRKRFLSVLATSQKESSTRNMLCGSDMYNSLVSHSLIIS